MSYDNVRARLNLYAVLPNLEEVVREDEEMRALVADARIVIKFAVAGGPRAWVRLADGVCTVRPGGGPAAAGGPAGPAAVRGNGDGAAGAASDDGADLPSVHLLFTSPAHLNRMFDGKGSPIPYWGFTHIGFLRREFTELTERMAYYLAPSDELLGHPGYLAMNTLLTLDTAAFAVPQLLDGDPDCRFLRHTLSHGSVLIKVLPDGPAVGLEFTPTAVRAFRGEPARPMARVLLPDLRTANDFLNGKLDMFAAVARGDIQIRGQIGLVDALALVLDRVSTYLTPAT